MEIKNGILIKIDVSDIDSKGHFKVGKDVTCIAAEAFNIIYYLKSVNISDHVLAIGEKAFWSCRGLTSVKLPSFLETIEAETFYFCSRLESIKIPKYVTKIGRSAFEACFNLKSVILSPRLETIEERAFEECSSLKRIKLPSTLKYIGERAFRNCKNLEEIVIPEGVTELKDEIFSGCVNLKRIVLPSTLKKIGKEAFAHCSSLKEIVLPEGLEVIEKGAFEKSGIEVIVIPKKVKKIKESTFSSCYNLKKVDLGNVEVIGDEAFSGCSCLKEVDLPSTLLYLGDRSFFHTPSLNKIVLPAKLEIIGESAFEESALESSESVFVVPASVKKIGRRAFYRCIIKNIDIQEGVEIIEKEAFMRTRLSEVIIPKSVKYIGEGCFGDGRFLKKVTLYSNVIFQRDPFAQLLRPYEFVLINPNTNEVKEIGSLYKSLLVANSTEGVIVLKGENVSFFDFEGNWVDIPCSYFESKFPNLKEKDYIAAYEWSKRKKFIPHYTIIQNMPVDEIDNFYINNNDKRWGQLVKLAHVDLDEEKGAFFKLCYSLGLFNVSSKDSEKAFEFIKNSIIGTVEKGTYHLRFGDLNVKENKFNKEFANLIFKYYEHDPSAFIYYKNDSDYLCAIYNNFELIKKTYPNKVVNTNTKNDMLTPELCIIALSSIMYKDVHPGNERLAALVGQYGYSQSAFENAQMLFEEGKRIPKEKVALHIKKDDENNLVTYELLDKDNPLGVILGDITNCCQTLTGAGRECLEYGLSERNSKFMVFRSGQTIIGQSWVWYDEKNKKICLDNIEVPNNVLRKQFDDESFKMAFIKCLNRAVNGFVEEMERKGFEVDSITIGKGYNDICDLLDQYYPLLENPTSLFGYSGYSDAKKQYLIYEKPKKK